MTQLKHLALAALFIAALLAGAGVRRAIAGTDCAAAFHPDCPGMGPSGVKVVPTVGGGLMVSFTDNAVDEIGFNIYFNSFEGRPWGLVTAPPSPGTGQVVTAELTQEAGGLRPDTYYVVWVTPIWDDRTNPNRSAFTGPTNATTLGRYIATGCGACSVFGTTPATEYTPIDAHKCTDCFAIETTPITAPIPATEFTSVIAAGRGSSAASVFSITPAATPTPPAAAPARASIASNDPSTVPAWPQLPSSSAQVEAVRSLQYLLQQCVATTLSVDGKFSPETDAAVRAFQTLQGLTADGKVGAATWLALIVPPMPVQQNMPMCMPMPPGMSMPPMQQGSTGPAVKAVQSQLKSRNVALTVDGVFGKTTDTAVKAYQQGQGLPANGQVGTDTWQALLAGS